MADRAVLVTGASRGIGAAVAREFAAAGDRVAVHYALSREASSRGAYRGEPRAPAYGAAKAALIAFGNSLARALAAHRIAVATVVPGWTETEMAAESLHGPRGGDIRAESPFGRVATPIDVARAVLYLASPEAEFASGTTLDINGASYLHL